MKRNSDAKYLGYGLLIGMATASVIAIGLFIVYTNKTASAMIQITPTSAPAFAPFNTTAPTQPVVATLTFTPTPTLTYLTTPTESQTPLPSPTVTLGEQKAQTGEVAFTGSLSPEEQIRLYNTSITFIAPTTDESKQLGEKITRKGYGSPTLICGPLSIAILQSAGLIPADIIAFDFWLLNPFLSKDRALLNKVFPETNYTHHVIRTAINKVDYKSFPLQPGDFLYIKDGTGGNFEHMLVVNRVDSAGRAYSVTNYYTPQGFIINETLLYDPLDTSAGIFFVWTRKKFAIEGTTGLGGFELWRRRINQ